MSKEKNKLNLEDLKNLLEKHDQIGTSKAIDKLLDFSLQGKMFFDKNTIQQLKGLAMPFFYNIEENDQTIPVSQYQKFNSKIEKAQPVLFQEEREYSQRIIFNIKNLDHPMKFVKYLFPVYSIELNKRIAKKNKELLDICLNSGDSRDLDIEDFLVFFNKFRDFLIKRNFKESFNQLKTFLNNQNFYSKEVKAKIIEKIDEIIYIVKEQELNRKQILNDPTEFGRNVLRAVHYTQSHIEYFCSYVHRLVHIKTQKDRIYEGKYYRYNSKKFWEDKFIKMCKNNLKDFKALQIFLTKCCNELKKLRNINAHQAAGEITISKDYKMLVVPAIGEEEPLKIKHQELCDFIISYGVFINKIKIHPKSPYEISEDTIGIIK